jgi:hypothetical protein
MTTTNIYARPSRLSKPLLASLALAHLLILGATEQTLDVLWSKAHAAHQAQTRQIIKTDPIVVSAPRAR